MHCLAAMARARVPIVATIIGEGGSGGALALGRRQPGQRARVRDLQRHLARRVRVDPLEGRVEGRRGRVADEDDGARPLAAQSRRPDHRRARRRLAPGLAAAARLVDAVLHEELGELLRMTPDELVEQRYQRFRALGAFVA